MATDTIATLERAPAPGGRPLRVCQIVEATSAGVGRHVIDLVSELVGDPQLDIHLIWSPIRADGEFKTFVQRVGVPSMELPMLRRPGWQDGPATLAIRKYLRRNGPFDIVHGHSSKGGALARLAAAGTTAHAVYTPHALATMNPTMKRPARWAFTGAEAVLARLTGHLIAVSPEEAQHAARLGLASERISVVPNGLRPAVGGQRDDIRAEHGFAADDVVIGFVGRLVGQKHPELLVQAFVDVLRLAPKALLAIVGDGPLRQNVLEIAGRHGIGDRVRLLGERAGRPLMPGFDVFALPSRYEGLPYVVLEAMEAGLPIVTTTAANCSLLVENDVTGMITPAGSAGEMSRVLADLVLDDARRARLGQAARARVAEYDVQRMAVETRAVYARCLAG